MNAANLLKIFIKDYGTKFLLKDKTHFYGIFLSNSTSSNKMLKIAKKRIASELQGDFFMITSYESENVTIGDEITLSNKMYIVVCNSEVFLGQEVLYRLIHLKMMEDNFGEE